MFLECAYLIAAFGIEYAFRKELAVFRRRLFRVPAELLCRSVINMLVRRGSRKTKPDHRGGQGLGTLAAQCFRVIGDHAVLMAAFYVVVGILARLDLIYSGALNVNPLYLASLATIN